MRLAEALGISEFAADLRMWWAFWTLSTFARSLGERLIEFADRRDEQGKAPVVTKLMIDRRWEPKRPKLDAQYIGDHVYVATAGRVVRFKR